MIVIDKPAGVPVHPAGRYFHNSVIEIMRAERGHTWNPLPCNRLDRLTSGVMFIAKHAKAACQFSEELKSHTVQKEYLARVKGKFPDGIVLCDQPILKVSPQLGLNRPRANGKEARSKFRRLAYYPPRSQRPSVGKHAEDDPATPPADLANDIALSLPGQPEGSRTPPATEADAEGYSIVHCLPLTGRTHQLRVHLQFLGHPITNDPIYSNMRVFGPSLGRADASDTNDQEIIARLSMMGKTEVADTPEYKTTFQTPPPEHITQGGDPAVISDLLAREHDEMVKSYLERKGERLNGRTCETCGTELYSDPGVHELGIFLHAVSYRDMNGKWHYRSKMPRWAMPPPGMEGPTSVPEWTEEGEDVVVGTGRLGEAALVEGLGAVSIEEVKMREEMRQSQARDDLAATEEMAAAV
jgi:tRNA pseudouridine synthase 9